MATRQAGKSSAYCKKLLSFVQQIITKKQGKALLNRPNQKIADHSRQVAWECTKCTLREKDNIIPSVTSYSGKEL